MNSLPIPIPNSRGAVFVLGRVVVANAHSPDKEQVIMLSGVQLQNRFTL